MCGTKRVLLYAGTPGSLEEAIVLAVLRAVRPRNVCTVFHSSPMPALWFDGDKEGIVGWMTVCRFVGRSLIPRAARDAALVDGALEMLHALVHHAHGNDPVYAAPYVTDARRRFRQCARHTLGSVCWEAAAAWARV